MEGTTAVLTLGVGTDAGTGGILATLTLGDGKGEGLGSGVALGGAAVSTNQARKRNSLLGCLA